MFSIVVGAFNQDTGGGLVGRGLLLDHDIFVNLRFKL